MKFFKLILLLFPLSIIHAQETNLLVEQKLISDFSQYPVYTHLIEDVNGQSQWKEKYQYIDSIDVYAITYLSDGLRINGFLVKPKEDSVYPGIIYNRGGNRDFGSLKISTALLTMGAIAKEGYIVIASQYRGNGGSEGQEEFGGKDVNDVVILTEVLKEIKTADATNIGMYGWSRGGMMTYIALTKTNNIKAVVVGGAVSDVFANMADRPEMETHVMAELIPDYETNKENELYTRSAVKWADQFPKHVPILILHGTSDWRVKPEQSLSLALELNKYRIPYRLIMFEGGDHGINEHKKEVNEQIVSWFDRYLKNNEPLPDMEYHGK